MLRQQAEWQLDRLLLGGDMTRDDRASFDEVRVMTEVAIARVGELLSTHPAPLNRYEQANLLLDFVLEHLDEQQDRENRIEVLQSKLTIYQMRLAVFSAHPGRQSQIDGCHAYARIAVCQQDLGMDYASVEKNYWAAIRQLIQGVRDDEVAFDAKARLFSDIFLQLSTLYPEGTLSYRLYQLASRVFKEREYGDMADDMVQSYRQLITEIDRKEFDLDREYAHLVKITVCFLQVVNEMRGINSFRTNEFLMALQFDPSFLKIFERDLRQYERKAELLSHREPFLSYMHDLRAQLYELKKAENDLLLLKQEVGNNVAREESISRAESPVSVSTFSVFSNGAPRSESNNGVDEEFSEVRIADEAVVSLSQHHRLLQLHYDLIMDREEIDANDVTSFEKKLADIKKSYAAIPKSERCETDVLALALCLHRLSLARSASASLCSLFLPDGESISQELLRRPFRDDEVALRCVMEAGFFGEPVIRLLGEIYGSLQASYPFTEDQPLLARDLYLLAYQVFQDPGDMDQATIDGAFYRYSAMKHQGRLLMGEQRHLFNRHLSLFTQLMHEYTAHLVKADPGIVAEFTDFIWFFHDESRVKSVVDELSERCAEARTLQEIVSIRPESRSVLFAKRREVEQRRASVRQEKEALMQHQQAGAVSASSQIRSHGSS